MRKRICVVDGDRPLAAVVAPTGSTRKDKLLALSGLGSVSVCYVPFS
jgi:hypothetical protein